MPRPLALALATVLLFGCGTLTETEPGEPCTTATAVATAEVRIFDRYFQPGCFQVPVGTTVSFTNLGGDLHAVAADPGQPESFDSGVIPPGAKLEHTFSVPGTVRLHCTFTPAVRATAVIE